MKSSSIAAIFILQGYAWAVQFDRQLHAANATLSTAGLQMKAVTTATSTCTSAWTNQPGNAWMHEPGYGYQCTADCEWCGAASGQEVWTTTTTLSGSGTVAVDLRNSGFMGEVNLYKNGVLIRALTGCTRGTMNVDFQDGDVLTIDEHNTAEICLNSVTCMAQGTAPDVPDSGVTVDTGTRWYQKVCEWPAPAPAPSPASATGDPHLQNIHGEKFDLMRPGKSVLIQIPLGQPVEKALLTVEADARRLGLQCADIYFQSLNITGAWADKVRAGGLAFTAGGDETLEMSGWTRFGPLQLKVVRGRTSQGTKYLNFYVKHLSEAGAAVGGLLGEDDHTEAARPEEGCQKSMSLEKRATSSSDVGHTEAIASLA